MSGSGLASEGSAVAGAVVLDLETTETFVVEVVDVDLEVVVGVACQFRSQAVDVPLGRRGPRLGALPHQVSYATLARSRVSSTGRLRRA